MIVLWVALGIVGLSGWGALLWWLLLTWSPARAAKKASEEPLRGIVEALAVRMAGLEAQVAALPSELAGLRDEAKRAADRSTWHARRLVEERTAREEDQWAAENEGADDGDLHEGGGGGGGLPTLYSSVDGATGSPEREALKAAHQLIVQGGLLGRRS